MPWAEWVHGYVHRDSCAIFVIIKNTIMIKLAYLPVSNINGSIINIFVCIKRTRTMSAIFPVWLILAEAFDLPTLEVTSPMGDIISLTFDAVSVASEWASATVKWLMDGGTK